MSTPGLLGIVAWAAFPLVGAILGFCVARIAARIAAEPRPDRISRITSAILETTPLSILARVPSPADLQGIARGLLHGLVSGPEFLRAFREAVSGGVASVSSWKVKDFINRTGLSRFVSENVLGRLAEEESRRLLARSIGSVVSQLPPPAPGGPPAGGFSAALAPLVPAVVDRLIEGLTSPETRELLAARGRELLPKILEKLNVLQRFLLSAGQFDRRIDEKMPEIVDETIAAVEQIVRDPSQQALFLQKLLQGVRDWRSSPSTSAEVGPAIAGLVEQALSRLADPRLRGDAPMLLEALLGGGDQILGAVLRLRFGVRDTELADGLANAALSWLSLPANQDALSARLADAGARFIAAHANTALGAFLKITPERKARLDSFVEHRLRDARRSWSGTLARRAGLIGATAGAAIGIGIGVVEALLGLLRSPLP
ncbi:MAG TPA: hypothetical protein VMV03_02000 [Spirochaetia bacterium]|nr:hypothetical protein [Spirochaetia bacterium]